LRVEGGVEDRNLRDPGSEELGRGADPPQVRRVVEGCQLDALLDPLDHLPFDPHGALEPLAAVDDPMADGVEVREGADPGNPRFRGGRWRLGPGGPPRGGRGSRRPRRSWASPPPRT